MRECNFCLTIYTFKSEEDLSSTLEFCSTVRGEVERQQWFMSNDVILLEYSRALRGVLPCHIQGAKLGSGVPFQRRRKGSDKLHREPSERWTQVKGFRSQASSFFLSLSNGDGEILKLQQGRSTTRRTRRANKMVSKRMIIRFGFCLRLRVIPCVKRPQDL